MRSYSLLIFLLFFSFLSSKGQENTRNDLLGNQYSWSSFELIKMDSKGEFLFSWQNPSGGEIIWVDPSNPFRILTFTKESNQIIWLDNKLSPIGDPISLDQLGMLDISGICVSKDGGLWAFDQSTRLLIKLDQNLKKQIEAPFRIKLDNSAKAWVPMMEWKQQLYFLTPSEQIIVTDLFGQVSKHIPLNAKSMHVNNAGLLFITEHDSYQYSPETGMLKSLIKKP